MTVLILAPHADDEVLGMGGTIARMSAAGRKVVVGVLTGHGDAPHPFWLPGHWDGIRKECLDAAAILGVARVVFKELPAACLDVTPAWRINGVVRELIDEICPTDVYLPFPFDLHKDHGAISYAASVALRPYQSGVHSVRRILAYETLSETHLAYPYLAPGFQPNVFVDITANVETKIRAMQAYASQLQADFMPRSVAGLRALATFRGTHIGCAAAEAFVLLGEYHR